MSNLNGEAPIQRIIKKKGGHGGHHGGAWKVAYADFVTAMMALFIVLWIMAQSQSIRQNVAQYFKNPGLLPQSQGLMETSSMGGEMPTPGHSQELQLPSPAPADVTDDAKRFEETKKKIQEMIAQLPDLEGLKDMIRMEITDEGLRIELMEREDARFFEVGSANINLQAQKIFGIISKELGRLPNHLMVEGHTDSRPYGSNKNYSNWELSSDRANAARRLMDGSGLKAGQVAEVRGYADRHPFNRQDPNDYRNRRVSIIVKPLSKDTEAPLPVEFPVKNGAPKNGSELSKGLPLLVPTPPAAAAVKAPPPAPEPKPVVAAPAAAVAPPSAPAAAAVKLPQPAPVSQPAAAAPALPVHQPPAAVKPKAAAAPAPEANHKTAAISPPPPSQNEPKTEKGPLEDNLGLQKELLNLAPPPPVFQIK
ncbi:MAG: flagellar motor protein MotB [Desulfobaccales bacterium]